MILAYEGIVQKLNAKNQLNWSERLDLSFNWFTERERLVNDFAWAVPNQKAIELLVKHSPIVEIGAGKGYWADLVHRWGGNIIGYDKAIGEDGLYQLFHEDGKFVKPWFHGVFKGGPEDVKKHSDRSLFLCWPPLGDPMAADALKAYTGDTVIYVGEYDGCCGSSEFFEILEKDWEEVETLDIPQFPCMHDYMWVYKRKY